MDGTPQSSGSQEQTEQHAARCNPLTDPCQLVVMQCKKGGVSSGDKST